MQVPFYIIDTNNQIPVITLDDTVYVDEKSAPDKVVSEVGTADADRDSELHVNENHISIWKDLLPKRLS